MNAIREQGCTQRLNQTGVSSRVLRSSTLYQFAASFASFMSVASGTPPENRRQLADHPAVDCMGKGARDASGVCQQMAGWRLRLYLHIS
jgi:hypothetical protein